MIIRVTPDIRQALKTKPEYAMGYQVVTIRLRGMRYEEGFVFGGRVFVSREDIIAAERDANARLVLGLRKLEIQLDTALNNPISHQHEIQEIVLKPRSTASLLGVRRIHMMSANTRVAAMAESVKKADSGPAMGAPVTSTMAGEIFKRFTAFKDDFRVTEGRGFTPGTFATTEEDARNVRTGVEAVARYALQNKTPAKWRFTIKPPEKTKLQRGIVEPAYGEPGGGVEVIFVDGSPDGTVYGPDEIPER